MKKNILTIALFALASFLTLETIAQKKGRNADIKGHWQVVSNINQKNAATVQFYAEDNTLMYQETITNFKLNAERRKVQRKLDGALKESYRIWTTTHAVQVPMNLVAKRMK